jgi:pyridinium-3,5-bisthiocarboxylic acid mononucleotide nickel chelatase
MRIAYLDCFSGMSGDMFLGALVDAGIPKEIFEQTVAALNIGARLEVSRVNRSGIAATKVDVFAHGEKDLPREIYWERQAAASGDAHGHSEHQHHSSEHPHSHQPKPVELLEHNYVPPQEPKNDHGHTHEPNHSHEHSRGLKEIRQIIDQSPVSAGAKSIAIRIFEALGTAEAKIHNTNIEKIHFHEVGAVDAIVDIMCAAVGFEALRIEELIVSPLNVGGGTVKCAHGTLPVPAPATLELLKGAPIYSTNVQAELVTPTGAAIVRTLATRFAPFPAFRVEKIGYGAGTRDFPGQPNVVRLSIGETQAEFLVQKMPETVTVLEANLDDLNPQVFGYVMDKLFADGALDAFGLPVHMKKNRPGMLLTVLCHNEDAGKLSRLIFTETTTLGIRHRKEKRTILDREWVNVRTEWGDVRIKIARLDGIVVNYAPEYEDCKRIAVERHVPLKNVMQEAMDVYRSSHRPGEGPETDEDGRN